MSDQHLAPALDYRCSCDGCWACSGREDGCTCDVDWDRLYEEARNGR